MNKNLIAVTTFILSSVVCLIVKKKADAQFLSEKAADLVQAEKSTADISAYEEAKKAVALRNDLLAEEKKILAEQFAAWKKEKRIDAKKKDIYSQENRAIEDFKKTFGYKEAISELNQRKDESLEAFRISIDYDNRIEELEDVIKKAEEKWEEQKALFELADDDISDTATKLRHAAEDVKNNAVKQAKEEIAELKKKLDAEKDIWDKKLQKTTREYEEKIAREKTRLHGKAENALSDIDRECDQAYHELENKLHDTRTDAQSDAVAFYEDNKKLIKTHDEIDKLSALDIFQNTPIQERLAWWFNKHGWPKWLVAVVGMVPVIALNCLTSAYTDILVKTVKAM